MRDSRSSAIRSGSGYRLLFIFAAACAFSVAPHLSAARTPAATITVRNNSRGELRHLYLSPPDNDAWGEDQLNGVALLPGESFTLADVSCAGPQVKVIGENQDGCFFTAVVDCAAGTTWTVSNEDAPDCGD